MAISFVSPHFTHEKLESATYVDLVDVFEDRMRHWILEPAKRLLELKHGYVSAIALLLSYFEAIEIYCTGKDSNGRSRQFFRNGFQRVFSVESAGAHVYEKIVHALYSEVRCGFAHDGLFRNRVFFDETRSHPLNITWPRKNGRFVDDGHLESVVLNPQRFCESINAHFERYIATLRAESDADLKANFLAVVDLKWGLNEPDRIIGMTEDEYLNGP
jgi:hypothetical protein